MRYVKWLMACLAVVMALTGCAGNSGTAGNGKEQEQRVVVDMTGKQVALPPNINRIADAWPAHHDMLCMLGAGEKIVATIDFAKRPWIMKINPQIKQATTVFDMTNVNIEALLKTKPDIVFMTTMTEKNAAQVAGLGIPTVQMYFYDFATLKECVRMTGTILGGESIPKAEKYIAYLDEKLGLITGATAAIPRVERPKVLHITTLVPLAVDGRDTIMNEWIEVAGGINAADVSGNSQQVSMEKIIKWNPDIIIFGNAAGVANKSGEKTSIEDILRDERWRQVDAVKKGKIYINPEGVFLWDRYGIEEALQIQWAAKLLHPDKFTDLDMVKETRYFYNTFYQYDLSEAQARDILAGKAPLP